MNDNIAERPKHKHVDQQMRPIGMQQTIAKKPVPLLVLFDVIWVEFQFLKQFIVSPGHDGYQGCDYYDYDGHLLIF